MGETPCPWAIVELTGVGFSVGAVSSTIYQLLYRERSIRGFSLGLFRQIQLRAAGRARTLGAFCFVLGTLECCVMQNEIVHYRYLIPFCSGAALAAFQAKYGLKRILLGGMIGTSISAMNNVFHALIDRFDMTSQIELIPISEGNRVILKVNEKLTVGRGSSLGCDDKKISRHHAELIFKEDETLWITPTHTNPVFYRSSQGKTIQLVKDQAQQLNDADQIGLLPTSYFFRVSFLKDEKNPVRKLPDWMTATSTSSSKRPLSDSEEKKDEVEEEKKTSNATGFDSIDSSETPPIKKSKTTTTRPACPYGATCYRKNPAHRTEQSHPGDSDSEDKDKDENESKTTKSSDDKPVCPYGKSCYRKNPQHISDYQH